MKQIIFTITDSNRTYIPYSKMGVTITHTPPNTLYVKYGMTEKTYVDMPIGSIVRVTLYPKEHTYSLMRVQPPHNPQKIFNAYFRIKYELKLAPLTTPYKLDKDNGIIYLNPTSTVTQLHNTLHPNKSRSYVLVNMLNSDVASLKLEHWLKKFSEKTYYKREEAHADATIK